MGRKSSENSFNKKKETYSYIQPNISFAVKIKVGPFYHQIFFPK